MGTAHNHLDMGTTSRTPHGRQQRQNTDSTLTHTTNQAPPIQGPPPGNETPIYLDTTRDNPLTTDRHDASTGEAYPFALHLGN
eukprot:6280245-Heterocapsa_arctica.AAC.1